ncbi:hypothetical protein EIN_031260 [Entamoeba invadens IP1]|uniref:Uncharacterized protein n=1 Tax=Entamoeba invadens IP1 TaxID=370355 RepID=A0A0A1TY56_ENTIV|nr:hypothetical protein EIN_031260 [Entamoeba invadens IP1]ELP86425.1 hypothetical protein EIN_031260 [Entamoeba invadens IP1]|eukprot:XP_004185771.1 hypothetical protein EIN_031260 [Entamoeba invadens IP1]
MAPNTCKLHQEYTALLQTSRIYRYRSPQTLLFKQLQFYSSGALNERISKLVVTEFGNYSTSDLKLLRDFVYDSKKEVSVFLKISEAAFDVFIAECLLSNNERCSIFVEDVISSMFVIGAKKYFFEEKKNCFCNETDSTSYRIAVENSPVD